MSASSVKWIYLGDVIKQRREKFNGTEDLPIRGVSREGFIPPKQKDADLSKYNVFYNNDFVFNPARMELNSIALNIDLQKGICSSLYEVFSVDSTIALPEYLNLFIKRDEFARQCEYIGFGSAREYCRIRNISEIRIPIPISNGEPDIDIQQELVDTYNGLKALAEQNEALIKPLSDACQAYIVDCKKKYPEVELGGYIEEYDKKNSDNKIKLVKSVSVTKEFKETNAKVNKAELSGYKIVPPNHIAYVQTTKNEKCFANALNTTSETYVVTQVNRVIYSKDDNLLNIEYLHLILRGKEFDRYAIFNSWGSARETFDWTELCRVSIPLPPIDVQQAIVNIYNCAEEAKIIAAEAREKMKTLCPALVQRAING